jgi:hypothetical protein
MQMSNLQLYISTDHNAEKGPTIFPPGPPNPLSCSPFNFLAPLKMNESTSPAIVNTPPMIAHVLHVSLYWSLIETAYEVRKWAKDCRVSV